MSQIRLKGSIKTHSQPVYGLSPGRQPHTVFTCGSDAFIAEWNTENFTQEKLTIKLEIPVYAMLYDPAENLMYAGNSSGGLHVISLSGKVEEKHLIHHRKGIFKLLYNKSQHHLYTCGGDGKFSVWDKTSMQCLRTFTFCDEKLRTAALSPDETLVMAGGNDGVFHLLETTFYNEIFTSPEYPEGISASAFSPCGKYILLGFKDAHLGVFDIEKQELTSRIPAHYFAIYGIAYSPSGKFFATCSRDKTIKIWDSDTFRVIHRVERPQYPGHTHSVNCLLWLNEHTLASSGDDRQLLLWEIYD